MAIAIFYCKERKKERTKNMKKNETIIMEAKPNTLETHDMLMLLGHTLHEKNGNHYNIIVDFKSDSCKLVLVK